MSESIEMLFALPEASRTWPDIESSCQNTVGIDVDFLLATILHMREALLCVLRRRQHLVVQEQDRDQTV